MYCDEKNWKIVEARKWFEIFLILKYFFRAMALWPGGEQRQSLSSLYEKIYKDDESENLWASLLKG